MDIPNLYQADADELSRKQALANALMQGSLQPIETSSVNGIPTPISPLQGLAKMFQGYQAGNIQRDVTQGKKDLNVRYQTELANALNKYNETGSPESLLMSGNPLAQQIGVANFKSQDDLNRDMKLAEFKQSIKSTMPGEKPSNVREWEYFKNLSPAEQQQYLNVKRQMYEVTNIGNVPNLVGRAPGLTPTPLSTLPNEVSGKAAVARGVESGKSLGEADSSLAAAQASYPQLENTVNSLKELGKRATYTYPGQAKDFVVRQMGGATSGAIAREEYIQTVRDVLFPQLRQTFGAQFTVKEGEALIATLGDPNKSPQEKNAALDSFIEQKKQHIQSLQRQTGQTVIPQQNQPSPGNGKGYSHLWGG